LDEQITNPLTDDELKIMVFVHSENHVFEGRNAEKMQKRGGREEARRAAEKLTVMPGRMTELSQIIDESHNNNLRLQS